MSTVASDVRCFDPTLLRHSAWSRSDNLHDRITEARREGWLGEVAGLETSLAAAEQKLQAARQLGARPTAITNLGMPGTAARAER